MKTILVATDFTPAAFNALKYAIKIARPFNAKVILYHAYLTETYIPDFVLLPTETNLQEQCERLLQLELDILDPGDKINIETKCEPGVPADKIIEAAGKYEASVIIAGMKKNGKTYRKIFGTTALTVSRRSTVPVLVIPEECSFNGVKSMALASDLHIRSNPDFAMTVIEFAQRFNSAVYVLNVIKNDADKVVKETDHAYDLNWRLRKISPQYKFIREAEVGTGISKFVKEKKVDILAMVSHPHSIFEKLLVKSNIKEMMFEGAVPILVLPDRVLNNSAANELAGSVSN